MLKRRATKRAITVTVPASVLLVLSICSLANMNFNPFLYFRF